MTQHIVRLLGANSASIISPVTIGAAVVVIAALVVLLYFGRSSKRDTRVFAQPHTVQAVIFSFDEGTQSWTRLRVLNDELRSRGFFTALVTSLPRAAFEKKMRDLTTITESVDAIVTGNEGRGKPSADLWLEAARRLRVDALRCLAFDEGPAGIAGAQAAGMLTAAVGKDVAPRFRALSRDIQMPDWLLSDVSAFDARDIELPKIAPLPPRPAGLEALLGFLPPDSPLAKCLAGPPPDRRYAAMRV